MSAVDVSKFSTTQSKKAGKIPMPPLSAQGGRAKPAEGKTAASDGSPVKARTRHTSGKEKKVGGIHRSRSKENLPPASAKKTTPKRYWPHEQLQLLLASL